MNKTEAAAYLGISTRSLERYVNGTPPRLTPARVKVKTGWALDFDPADLDSLKLELDSPPARAVVVDDDQAADDAATLAAITRPPRHALATRPISPDSTTLATLAMVAEQLAAVAAAQQAPARPVVEVKDKLTLSVVEAAALSGYPAGALRKALADGTLKGRKVGRGVRVARGDLERFCSGDGN